MGELNDLFREREVIEMERVDISSVHQAPIPIVLLEEPGEIDLGEGMERRKSEEDVNDQVEETPLDEIQACKE
jgi:hypothetical protein